jgi:hypothetical protein
VKAACGLAVTDTSFHATTLTYWRRRLAASKSAGPDLRRGPHGDQADRGDQGKDPAGAGLHRARRRGRHPGHGDPVGPGAEAVLVGRETACDYTRPGKPDIAWDDKAAKAGYGSSRRHPDDCCGWFVRLCAHANGTERGFGDLRVGDPPLLFVVDRLRGKGGGDTRAACGT